MRYEQIKEFTKNRGNVLLLYKDSREYFGKIYELTPDKLYLEISMGIRTSFALKDITQIISKEHIYFLKPKSILDKKTDAAITWYIETVKMEKEFTLQTRKYKLQMSGNKTRVKWSAKEFESAVAKWLTPNSLIEIYPFAFVKIGCEQFLLVVDKAKTIQKIGRDGNTIPA